MKAISQIRNLAHRFQSWWNSPQSYVWGIPLGLIAPLIAIALLVFLVIRLLTPVVIYAN